MERDKVEEAAIAQEGLALHSPDSPEYKVCAAYLASARREERMREALKPLSVLQMPERPQGNAGFYSLYFKDILRARTALSYTGEEEGK